MTGEEYNNQFSEEELKNEIWKAIPDFEGYYEVSTLGRIRSVDRYVICRGRKKRLIKGKLLKPRLYKDGYFDVKLHKDNHRYKTRRINRLVALTFIPNSNSLPYVNHKDENPLNNRVDNLEWCTHRYNMNYGTIKFRIAKTLSKPINQYDKQGDLLRTYSSIKEASNQFQSKYADTNISHCLKGTNKTAYGYIWKYVDEKEESIKKWELWKDSKKIK